MHLFVVRHAIAVDRFSPQVSSDPERWLTDEGIAKMKQTVRGFQTMVDHLDMIYTSPYVRAIQTADLLAQGWATTPEIETTDSLEPMVDFSNVADLLTVNSENQSIALVGHEPDLSEFVSTAVFGDDTGAILMKKAAIAWLEVPPAMQPGSATLMALLQPKVLRGLA